MNIPPKPVSHNNVARVLLMVAHILQTMISFWATHQINMAPTVKKIGFDLMTDNEPDIDILFMSHEYESFMSLRFGQISICENQKLHIPISWFTRLQVCN